MKKFISGLLIGLLLATSITAFAASTIKTAYFSDTTKLTVDGKSINTEILYAIKSGQANGSNYVGARALAEALGATVDWKDNTIIVTSKGSSPASTSAPIAGIDAKIKAKAEADWPNDYSMQLYEIKRQTEAYEKIQALPKTADYNANILTKAIADWPDDYAMQVYQYDRDLQAFKEINN